jgi:hypothetical protein
MTYRRLGQVEKALRMRQEVYAGHKKLHGEEHESTLFEATNYASTLLFSRRYKEAKALLRKFIPVAERDFGNSHLLTLMMRMNYAGGLYEDSAATLDDVREAVTTLEDTARIARRVFGSAHPKAVAIEQSLRDARAVLYARETPPARTFARG